MSKDSRDDKAREPAVSGVSRRSFLKTLSTSAAGAVVATRLPAEVEAAPEPSDGPHGGSELLSLRVNGKAHRLLVEPNETLLELLRERLKLTGTKQTCNRGMCGVCTVLLDGEAVYSCHMLALDAAGREVTTIEGLLAGEQMDKVQSAFAEHDGLQCGFCTPGQILAATSLLKRHPKPTREQIVAGMSGNLCRCSAYPKIIESVEAAAGVGR